MNTKTTILLGILVLLILGFVVFWDNGESVESPSPEVSESVSPEPSDTAEPTASPIGGVIPAPTKETSVLPRPPATDFAQCSLGGELVFKEQHLAVNKSAVLEYSDVDSISRHIIWKITPDSGEEIDIGPNLFAGLVLPDGEENITVVFYDEPKHDSYKLTAKVTYGVLVNGEDVEVREADCSGKTSIDIDY
ncbi:MAG: hypothetical protein ABH833_00680 [Parcubacteria group bacterium]